MTEEETRDLEATISRRELVKRAGVGMGGVVLAGAGAPSAWARVTHEAASEANTLKIGYISPLTGGLAGFGEADPWIVGEARKALAKGLTVGGKTYAVQFIQKDTQSDPVRAGQLAKTLINRDKIDLMLSTSTPETNNPVADACEAAGVPQVSTVEPWEAWYFGRGAKPGAPSPFKWTHHFSFGVADFAAAYIGQWKRVPTNKKVGVMWPNDADGNAIRAALGPMLQKAGYTIVDPGAYEDGTTDYSSQIAKFKAEKCEIFNTFPLPPDFAVFWRQAAQQGYRPKIVQIAKTGLFASQVEALGALGYNVATAIYWGPAWPYRSALLNMSNQQLADAYTKATGRQWLQQIGSSLSLVEVGLAALTKSGNPKNKAAVANAFKTLKVNVPIGVVDFKTGPVPGTVDNGSIIGSQWVKTKPGSRFKIEIVVTDNAGDPKVPIQAKLKPYR